MKKKNIYKEFLDDNNQAIYRERLGTIMTKEVMTKQQIAFRIGISVITLRRFIMGECNVRPIALKKIAMFVDSYLKEK